MRGARAGVLAGIAAAGMALASGAALAQANPPQAASPAPATGILADPVFQAAQKRYEALPDGERRAIQEALMWTGDFSGAGSGAYGPLTFKAIQAFQKRASAPTDGYLQPKERAALEAAADRGRGEVRFTRLQDGKAGLRIGVPQAVLTKTTPSSVGTRYASADASVALDTFARDDSDLPGLFERLKADAPGRKVSYKVLRPDWFVISADQDGKRSYTRFATSPSGLKGFVFTYPIAAAATYDRIAIAIANSFEPAPATQAAPAPGAAAVTPAPATPVSPPPSGPLASGPLATGLVIGPGKVLTSAAIEACAEPTVAGKPAKLGPVDKALGLALLDAPGVKAAIPAAGARPVDGAAVLVLGLGPAGAGEPCITITAGEARVTPSALRIVAAVQKGASGSPVFDRSGALAGIVGAVPQQPRLVAGIVPEASYPVVAAEDIARFAGLATAPSGGKESLGAADVAQAMKGAVVAVGCRK